MFLPSANPAAPGTWDQPDHFLSAMSSPWFRLVTTLQDEFTRATVAHWNKQGVRNMHLPITTSSISSPMGMGSDSLPVEVELFGVRTWLADSMQFMLEYGCRLHESGAYYVMPSFRGEQPDARHLPQFFHSEAEIPGGLDDVMAEVEGYLSAVATALLKHADAICTVAGDVAHLERIAGLDGSLPRLTFDEAAARLEREPGAVVTSEDGRWRDLTHHGERALMQQFGGFVWVTHYDHLNVPFYQAFGDAEHSTALNADLLFGIGETVGAGERHASDLEMAEALELHEVDGKSYTWYSEMKRAAPMQTAGFGMGVERMLLWVLKHDDIRDMQLLPRSKGRRDVP